MQDILLPETQGKIKKTQKKTLLVAPSLMSPLVSVALNEIWMPNLVIVKRICKLQKPAACVILRCKIRNHSSKDLVKEMKLCYLRCLTSSRHDSNHTQQEQTNTNT